MNFPTLYKKTSTGAIQFWDIQVDDDHANSIITTSYGQVNTDSPQVTKDKISAGKNYGKKNSTDHFQQAVKEACSKHEKQKKKGYVESIEAAQNEELDELIEGGIVPMLAQSFYKHGHKIKYPSYVQPKLDGIRCIAIVKDGKCELWSRTRKLITSLPHIVKEIEDSFKDDVILDGEIYNHKFKNNFEHIVHLVRQEEPDAECTDAEYWIYDVANDEPFVNRSSFLSKKFSCKSSLNFKYLKMVNTYKIEDHNEAYDWFPEFIRLGFEGAMLRNSNGLYVNKRSYDLQKVKEFEDSEFKIIGIDEGRGKLSGHVGAFVCLTSDGKEFLAKMSGETTKLKEYFENHDLWKGKQLTVQYQGLTGTNGVPRFPVGLRIRKDL